MKITDLEQKPVNGQGHHPYFVHLRNLGAALDFTKLQVHEEELHPGQNASNPHYHSSKEEMVVVLEGTILMINDGRHNRLHAGEFTGFTPGKQSFHVIRNNSDKTARYLPAGTVDVTDITTFI